MKEAKGHMSSYDIAKQAAMTGPHHGRRRFDWIDLVCWIIALSALGSLVVWWLYW